MSLHNNIEAPARIGLTWAMVSHEWGLIPGPMQDALRFILTAQDTGDPTTALKTALARLQASKDIIGPLRLGKPSNLLPSAVAAVFGLSPYLQGALLEMRWAAFTKGERGLERLLHIDAAMERVHMHLISGEPTR